MAGILGMLGSEMADDDEPDAEAEDTAAEMAAEDVMAAFKARDIKALNKALKAHYAACEGEAEMPDDDDDL